jgi:hypothetical protein
MNPAKAQEMREKMHKAFRHKLCLHPDAPDGCSRPIVAAHSVQKARIIQHLSENQHVVKLDCTTHPRSPVVLLSPERVGVNKATTFHGFCGKHDDEVFKPLETGILTPSPQQVALMGFRAFARDLHQKMAEREVCKMVLDEMTVAEDGRLLEEMWRSMGILNAERNLRNHWSQFRKIVSSGDTHELRYWAARLSGPPVISACCTHLPEWGCDGSRLQDLSRAHPFDGLAFTVMPSESDALFVFCWHAGADKICSRFVGSVSRMPSDRLPSYLIGLAFEMGENVIFRESWWKGQRERDRRLLVNRGASGIWRDRDQHSLADDSVRATNAKVVDITQHGDS